MRLAEAQANNEKFLWTHSKRGLKMFRMIKCSDEKKLMELSIKQREDFMAYQYETHERQWHLLVKVRPAPVIIPPRSLEPETPRSSPTL